MQRGQPVHLRPTQMIRWSGVILGPDLVARHGRMVTVREANKDPDFKRRSVSDLQYDRHIRNIYKVLFTRGMIGTVIYSVDPQTQEFLAELIEAITWPAGPAPELTGPQPRSSG